MTALHVASGAGQSAVVTSLLDHGTDVHAVNEVGDSIYISIVLLLGHSFCGYLHF